MWYCVDCWLFALLVMEILVRACVRARYVFLREFAGDEFTSDLILHFT